MISDQNRGFITVISQEVILSRATLVMPLVMPSQSVIPLSLQSVKAPLVFSIEMVLHPKTAMETRDKILNFVKENMHHDTTDMMALTTQNAFQMSLSKHPSHSAVVSKVFSSSP